VRSAEKAVSPLSWFTPLSCAEVSQRLHAYFAREFHTRNSELTDDELDAAMKLVASKYSSPAWINRLP
jgi:lipoate-protein ligase A